MDYLQSPADIVKEISSNQIWTESVCVAEKITQDALGGMLIDYSLYCGEKDMLPMKRHTVFFGFHRWLRNQGRFQSEKIEKQKPNESLGGLVL